MNLINPISLDTPKLVSSRTAKEKLVDAKIENGKKLFKKGFERAAEAEFRSVLMLDPQNTEAMLQLGKIHLEKGHHEKAAELAIKAYTINPDLPSTNSAMGAICLMKGDALSAEKFLKKAIDLGTDDYTAYGNLGTLYFSVALQVESKADRQKLIRLATLLYFKAYEIEPEDDRNNANIAAALQAVFKETDPENPLPEYFIRRAITLRPSNEVNWINLSKLTGQTVKELTAIYRVSKAEVREARFLKSIGSYKLAAIRYEQSLKFYGMFPENQLEYAELCLLAYRKTNDTDFINSAIGALEKNVVILNELASLEKDCIDSQIRTLLDKADKLRRQLKKIVDFKSTIPI